MVKIGKREIGEFPLLLAPMEDVSDPPFRNVCKENGADVLYSEFISSEGLIRDAMKSKKKLDFSENERPFGIQIFGGDEEAMALATKIVDVTNPDFIDINFGCPVKKVVCKGAGAAVLKDVSLMVKLTQSVIQSTRKPVTIKTRLGWDEKSINILEVAEKMQDIGVQAITIHARTRAQMYKGEADWSYIARVKENTKIHIPIFGNGDIDSPQKALEYKNKYGVDGIMIGRASIGYPWIFREIKHFFLTQTLLPPPSIEERVEVAKKHLYFSIRWKGEVLGILEMRRHYAHYFKNIPHFKGYKNELVQAKNSTHLLEIFEKILTEKEEHSNTES